MDGPASSQQIDPEELDRFVNMMANFFLTSDVKKIPVKRTEITKLIPKEYMKKTTQIIEMASNKLQHIYGYKIVEMKTKKGCYLLVNNLEDQDFSSAEFADRSDSETLICGLRTMVLALIFMNEGVVPEGVLRTFFAKFNIDFESNEKLPTYGSISKLITQDFVRQCYLDVNIVRDVDPPIREFRWGERSELEVEKKKILGFVCQMYGDDVKPEMWLKQYKEAYPEQTTVAENDVVV